MNTLEQPEKLSTSPPLSAEERRARQRLYLRDAGAIGTLLLLAVGLSFVTYGLFHSFNAHRHMLETRWRARGEAALAAGNPVVALDDLHSALAYAPDDRALQIELATALAATGRTQEAQVYFSTLLETAPGNGPINLQLARLAIRQGNSQAAIEHYQAAIEGTWNGDAFTRRRDIRLELARYLLAQNRKGEARDLLLVVSSNSPADYKLQLMLGGLLEGTGDSAGAFETYRRATAHKATRLEALVGEAGAAEGMGRYGPAKQLLAQAESDGAFGRAPESLRAGVRSRLENLGAILAIYPSESLPAGERAQRIEHLAGLAQARLGSCPAAALPPPGPLASGRGTAPLADLAAHLAQLNPLTRRDDASVRSGALATLPEPAAGDPFPALVARWAQLGVGPAREQQMERDPAFAQSTLQLVYETVRATAGPCGPLHGDDALLATLAATQDPGDPQP